MPNPIVMVVKIPPKNDSINRNIPRAPLQDVLLLAQLYDMGPLGSKHDLVHDRQKLA